MPAGDVVVRAQWTQNLYTITFNTDGGSEVSDVTGPYGSAIATPANPTKEGYTFAGWSETIPLTMPANDMEITATWTQNKYRVRFVDENGTELKAAVEYAHGTSAASVVKPSDPTKAATAQYTYTFA